MKLLPITLTILLTSSQALAVVASKRPTLSDPALRDKARTGLADMYKARSTTGIAQLTTTLGVKSADVVSFLESQMSSAKDVKESAKAWSEVLNRTQKAGTTQEAIEAADATAQVVYNMLKLKEASPGSMETILADKQLSEMVVDFTPSQLGNLAKTLKVASQLAVEAKQNGSILTPEKAFEMALEKEGRLQAYLEGCK